MKRVHRHPDVIYVAKQVLITPNLSETLQYTWLHSSFSALESSARLVD